MTTRFFRVLFLAAGAAVRYIWRHERVRLRQYAEDLPVVKSKRLRRNQLTAPLSLGYSLEGYRAIPYGVDKAVLPILAGSRVIA